jgi:transcriptional regulator with XRE-family HTH domain
LFDLGLLLKNLRLEAGCTQAQIAKKLDVSVTTIGRWENNYKMPSMAKLIELSVLFNVPLNYLVGIDKEKAIVTDRLTQRQQNLLNTLVLEFQNVKMNKGGLSERQQDILNLLLIEFNDEE